MLFRIGKAWIGEQRWCYHDSQNANSQTVWYKREGKNSPSWSQQTKSKISFKD